MKRDRSHTLGTMRISRTEEAEACIASVARELSQGDGEYTMTPMAVRAIKRVRHGDHDALSFLYVRYAENVYSRARTVIDDHDAALEITRRVFAKLGSRLEQSDDRHDEASASPNADSTRSTGRIPPERGGLRQRSTRDDCANI